MSANTVLRSINAPGDARCVDIFQRPNGSFGFEEFRRDSEDNRGWFTVGGYGGQVFAGEAEALDAALAAVPWLREALPLP